MGIFRMPSEGLQVQFIDFRAGGIMYKLMSKLSSYLFGTLRVQCLVSRVEGYLSLATAKGHKNCFQGSESSRERFASCSRIWVAVEELKSSYRNVETYVYMYICSHYLIWLPQYTS